MTCPLHRSWLDSGKVRICKKELTVGELSDDDAKRRMAWWLLIGILVPQNLFFA